MTRKSATTVLIFAAVALVLAAGALQKHVLDSAPTVPNPRTGQTYDWPDHGHHHYVGKLANDIFFATTVGLVITIPTVLLIVFFVKLYLRDRAENP